MSEDKFKILRDFAKSNNNPNKTIYQYIKEVLDMNSAYFKENQELKKQLYYLRSGEYYNQLRFENEMLQQVVDTNGVPSEVYDYIDCTHRNTELLEETQKYKEVIDKIKKHCEIEINASNHYLKNHSSQKELCHKVAHQRVLDILKEVE